MSFLAIFQFKVEKPLNYGPSQWTFYDTSPNPLLVCLIAKRVRSQRNIIITIKCEHRCCNSGNASRIWSVDANTSRQVDIFRAIYFETATDGRVPPACFDLLITNPCGLCQLVRRKMPSGLVLYDHKDGQQVVWENDFTFPSGGRETKMMSVLTWRRARD